MPFHGFHELCLTIRNRETGCWKRMHLQMRYASSQTSSFLPAIYLLFPLSLLLQPWWTSTITYSRKSLTSVLYFTFLSLLDQNHTASAALTRLVLFLVCPNPKTNGSLSDDLFAFFLFFQSLLRKPLFIIVIALNWFFDHFRGHSNDQDFPRIWDKCSNLVSSNPLRITRISKLEYYVPNPSTLRIISTLHCLTSFTQQICALL